MPKRTNEFQQLVFLIRSALADGATVTESKMLRHRRTGTKREVDICIEGSAGGYPVVVCVECQKRNRPADVTWVEGQVKKHEHLPTNRLILVAPQFTPDALELAEQEGVTALSFENVDASDFTGLLGDTNALWAKSVTIKAEKVVVRVASSGEMAGEKVRAVPDQNVYDGRSGAFVSTLAPLVAELLNYPGMRDRLLALGAEEHRWFVFRWSAPRNETGFALCLQKEDVLHTLRGIEYIEISGPCEFKIAEFGLRRGKLGDVHVAWGSATVLDRAQLLVATRDAAGRDRITVMVEGAPPSTLELPRGFNAAPSSTDSIRDAMYYVIDRSKASPGAWGAIVTKHVLLSDAVAECSFLLRRALGSSDGPQQLLIADSEQELQEGTLFAEGAEINVFDAVGARYGNSAACS
jgi:hypothetical protein